MNTTSSEAVNGKRRVFIVDDHPLVRECLGNLINQQPDLETCGDASTASEALEGIDRREPDVAIVDISLEGPSGLRLIEQIKSGYPAVATIVLSMHDESLYAERALRAGARGYVMKRDATGKILEAIRRVLSGKSYLSERATGLMAERFLGGSFASAGHSVDALSGRELEVFQLLGRGLTTQQVAGELHISLGTVQAFCARIKKKLNLRNATELLREAVRWNYDRDVR